MTEVFGPKRVGEGMKRHPDGTWRPLSKRHRMAEAWMGHMSFGMHTQLKKPVPYFTVMRDPVAREVSRFRSMPFLRERHRKTPYTAVDPTWSMVYMASGIPLSDIDTLNESHVDLALKNMHEHFLYVGDTTRMDELGLWMRRDLRWDVQIPLPHENKSGDQVEVTKEEIEELKEHSQVKLDQLLYDQVQELGPRPMEWRL
jgi:hypothetical protein